MTILTPGARLGPYKIEGSIGSGGMGQVFRATDTRLHRTVAIKVLTLDKVAAPDRKHRFLQEARAASALNHPNIVTMHDIASEGEIDYLVMEYVDGKSLDKIITPKGLPLAVAIGYATQIAGALAAAHSAGIVHRDIKPANVIVTSESQVKVLDFGLAKLAEPSDPDETATATGVIMGTPGYMSPEQAGARSADHRTDIFSLGVVLYEMLAGTRPFGGESHVDTMHQIIHAPAPPLRGVPPRVEDIVDKTLAKDPKERYQSAGDLAVDLRRFLKRSETDTDVSFEAEPIKHVRTVRWIVATLIVLAAGVVGWLVFGPASSSDNPLANATFTPLTDFVGDEVSAALSPDGKFAVFLSDRNGSLDVLLTQVGTGRFQNLIQGEKYLSASNSNRDLGFTGDGSEIWLRGVPPPTTQHFRLLPLIGGVPRPFLAENAATADWSPDGMHLTYFESDPGDAIFVADRDGSNPRQIYKDAPGIHNHFVIWSTDSRWIYFVHGNVATFEMDLWRIAPAGGQPEQLTHFNRYIGYPTPIDSKTVLYVGVDEDGSGPWLWAFDVDRKLSRRVTSGLERYTSIAASSDGRRLIASVAKPVASLWSVPIIERLVEEIDAKPYSVPNARALKPRFAGTSLFYLSSLGGGDGLWRSVEGQTVEVWKGADGALLDSPAVSPDGRQVAVAFRRNGKQTLRLVAADGSQSRPLAETLDVRGSASWSPDGNWIVIGGNDGHGEGLFKIPLTGGAPVRLVTGSARNPIWSLAGTMIVYAGENTSAREPLQAVRPDGSVVTLPSIALPPNGERIRFTPDGKGLVYMQGSLTWQDFWILDLTTQKTRQLTRLNNTATMRTFDISPDGKQIVFDRLRQNSDVVLIDLAK